MRPNTKTVGLYLGPALGGLLLLAGPPDGLTSAAWATAALLVLMATWWATEAIPIPATSLLPVVMLPLAGAGSPRDVGADYFHPIVLLLLGGFVIALGIERWGLHKRLALNIVARAGHTSGGLIFGFMVATALLSMWISNTATTLMMVPIALSAAAALGNRGNAFATALLLGVCYAASIGGVATPIGTPTNLITKAWLETEFGLSIGFPQWMAFGVPAMLLLVPAAWWCVTRGVAALADGEDAAADIRAQARALGPVTPQETRAALVFGMVALLWVNRLWICDALAAAGWPLLKGYGEAVDTMIAIAGAIAMFLVPARGGSRRMLLTWEEAERLPWGVLLLFGGGIALGNAVSRTGLSEWIGSQLDVLSVVPPLIFIAAVVTLVIFLTELTSNVATMTTVAPILGALAVATGVAPESLLAPAAVAASCAFMLPVATAPNAIVFASGHVPIGQMIRKGLYLNLFGIVIITAIGYWIAPMVF